MEYVLMLLACVFVNNIILSQFLGICPFLGVSGKIETAVGMSGAVIFVMAFSTLVTSLVNTYVLLPLNLVFLKTIAFILIIAALVQMLELILRKISPALYQALGIYLPLITTNCAVLGIAIQVTQKPDFSILDSTLYAAATAVGFGVAIVIFAGLREQLELNDVPAAMRGIPIALITAGILAMAFMGFANLV